MALRTLKQLRQDVHVIIHDIEGHIYRNSELDKALNNAYLKLQRKGEIIKDSLITTVISDQIIYDLTSSTIWIPESPTDTGETLNTTVTAAITTIVTDAAESYAYAVNQLIKMDSEIMRVTAFSTPNLTVVRAEGGTTAAAHTAGVTIYIGAQPNILSIKRVDYDTVIQDPIAQHEIADLAGIMGAVLVS